MATRGLKDVREALLISYANNLIDEKEFILLYDTNMSREVYSYWKFQHFVAVFRPAKSKLLL